MSNGCLVILVSNSFEPSPLPPKWPDGFARGLGASRGIGAFPRRPRSLRPRRAARGFCGGGPELLTTPWESRWPGKLSPSPPSPPFSPFPKCPQNPGEAKEAKGDEGDEGDGGERKRSSTIFTGLPQGASRGAVAWPPKSFWNRGDAARDLGTAPKRKRLQGSQGIGILPFSFSIPNKHQGVLYEDPEPVDT